AMDFPQHSKQVLEQLNQQRQLGLLCDCTFVVDGIDFKAHKAVLAACSEYFRMLFVDQKDVVHLDISNAAGLGQVLEFMYTAKLSLNPDNVEDVLAVAGFLQMQEIVSACNALKSLTAPPGNPSESQHPPAHVESNKVEGKPSEAEGEGGPDKLKPVLPDPERKEETSTAAAAQPEVPVEQLSGQEGADATSPEGPSAEFPSQTQPAESPVGSGSPEAKDSITAGTETGEVKLEGKEEEGQAAAEEEEEEEEARMGEEDQARLENGEPAEDNESGSTDSGQESAGEPRLLRSGSYGDRTESKAYGSVTHKCEDCGKEFTHTGNFKRHIRIHTGEKPFSCRECNKAFSDPAACKAHEKTH
ncbi:ZBT17 protein, partial [Semnornis frantzii]|nr:ZBT17 protein [Semnornis frantzii]